MQISNNRSLRAFISLSAACVFFFLLLSGAALYTAPPCSVARSIGWKFLLLGKESWETVHVTFTAAFIVLAPLHLYMNWGAFLAYVRMGIHNGGRNVLPLLFALAATTALFLASLLNQPPASWLYETHEKIKFSREAGKEGARGRGHGIRKNMRSDKKGRE